MMKAAERGVPLPPKLPLSRLSFRRQITLLGTLVVVLFLAVLFATFATLRYTKSAVLSSEKRQLLQFTENLAREYDDKAYFSRQNNEPPPLNNPSAVSSREVLALVARLVLQNADGVSGGFYSKSEDSLWGDSIATGASRSVGVGGPDSAEEQRAILQVSRNAVSGNEEAGLVISNEPGLVLVEAVPIRDASNTVGAAWCTKRLPVLPGANRFRAYLITVGLGLAAMASALLTLVVIRNLQGGVRKIEGGLRALEQNLASQIDVQDDPEEIRRIVQAIHRLGATLQKNIEHEKQIENQLRHADRLASLGRLVAGVAHEVRNPLATIRLRLQMARREANSPRLAESCAVALEEVERLNGMVNRLLTFARPVQLHLQSTDLRRLVEERVECFREQANSQHVRIVANFSEGHKSIAVDKGQIAQVFDNVIQNAIEAMAGTGGTLSVGIASIEASQPKGRVCVEFCDTGKGMAPAVVSHIFDPFFTTKPSGTGLGLSICHELITAHGGEIQVQSQEGRGTTVLITVPASAAAASG